MGHRRQRHAPRSLIGRSTLVAFATAVVAATTAACGTFPGGRTDTLKVPADVASRNDNVNLVARLLARSAAPSSGPIPIHPGDHLVVRLPIDQKMLVVLP